MNAIQFVDEFDIKSKTKGHWADICYANLIVIFTLMLAFFLSPISLALLVLAYIYLEPGLHKFILGNIRKQESSYEQLFMPPRLFIKAFLLKLVYLASIMLWSILLIVPGVIVALNYAFIMPVFVDEPDSDIRKILSRSKALMVGYRFKVMLVFLCCFIIIGLGVGAGFGIACLIGLAVKVPVWAKVILMVFFGALLAVFVALPFYESYLLACYETSLRADKERENQKRGTKTQKKVVNRK